MDQRIAAGVLLSVMLPVLGCTTLPRFVVNPDSDVIGGGSQASVSDAAPAGPKVASLVANLKCELWKAANSRTTLPYYHDDPDNLTTRNGNEAELDKEGRTYNLRNIFGEIEYVAEATFTLDVVDTGAFNPLGVLTKPLKTASGLLPATSEILSVGGTLSEAPHRYIQFNQAIDFSRLVPQGGPPNENGTDGGTLQPKLPPLKNGYECGGKGSELQGDLRLEEILASGMIAASMSDISVFPSAPPKKAPASAGTTPEISDQEKQSLQIDGVKESIDVSSNNVFGLISAQVDFTIIENVNGGPTWSLRYFKGPGGNNQGLFNLNRQVKDTLLVTFAPVCIRRVGKRNEQTGRYNYDMPLNRADMVEGTPGWANYLPPCEENNPKNTTTKASIKAQSINNLLQLNNFLQ